MIEWVSVIIAAVGTLGGVAVAVSKILRAWRAVQLSLGLTHDEPLRQVISRVDVTSTAALALATANRESIQELTGSPARKVYLLQAAQ